ncbi:related to mitochondrial tryptophanyl-tRNA synthetase [Rhynchosporium agropyri]|uniref:tryptophan--tRNA ligase n=1 Tax=Rhynchosporium agropyri TaxID=914238 RepID=A0A1E1JY33_9HELO|nr:related to mitochondrial tryptophanyl-tRNA synthetase [Rhynchosporium agropyri]
MLASARGHTRLLQHRLRSLLYPPHTSPLSPQSYSTSSSPPPLSSPPQTIFSGIQPTGIPHLGNYLGALKTWVTLQNAAPPSTKLFFSVVDLHAITLFQQPDDLRRWRRESLAALLAVGVDERTSTVFWQGGSKLSLADNTSPLDESSKSKLKLGLFSYPVLQAADILVHRATHVPVGEDQSQHLEFARECVTNFNHTYNCSHLVTPQTILSPTKRIMSLTSPLQKMSKSHPSPLSRILITDSPSTITTKLSSALTDSQNLVTWDPVSRPGVSNLLTLLSSFDKHGRSAQELGGMLEKEGMGLGAFKKLVAGEVREGLRDVRERFERVLGEKGYVEEVARRGAVRARESAEETMVLVREAVGL